MKIESNFITRPHSQYKTCSLTIYNHTSLGGIPQVSNLRISSATVTCLQASAISTFPTYNYVQKKFKKKKKKTLHPKIIYIYIYIYKDRNVQQIFKRESMYAAPLVVHPSNSGEGPHGR